MLGQRFTWSWGSETRYNSGNWGRRAAALICGDSQYSLVLQDTQMTVCLCVGVFSIRLVFVCLREDLCFADRRVAQIQIMFMFRLGSDQIWAAGSFEFYWQIGLNLQLLCLESNPQLSCCKAVLKRAAQRRSELKTCSSRISACSAEASMYNPTQSQIRDWDWQTTTVARKENQQQGCLYWDKGEEYKQSLDFNLIILKCAHHTKLNSRSFKKSIDLKMLHYCGKSKITTTWCLN